MADKDLIILGLDGNLSAEDAVKFLEDVGDWTTEQVKQMKFLVQNIGKEMNEQFKELKRSLGMAELPGEKIFEELGSEKITEEVTSMLDSLQKKVKSIAKKPIGAIIDQVLEGKTLSDDELTFFQAILENAKDEFSEQRLDEIKERVKKGKSLSQEDKKLLEKVKDFYFQAKAKEEEGYPPPETKEEEGKREQKRKEFAEREVERRVSQLIESGVAPFQARRIGKLFRHWDEDISFSMCPDEAYQLAKDIITQFEKKRKDKDEVKVFSSDFSPNKNLAQDILSLTPKNRS